ncbi:MAG: hypothetical protein JXX29_22895 [Deltaproteobacteria bacterium]|nr:hypothetical protein [Deltaproteobacteria bacterium]MBN2674547.1 hypothetical protein [Deltaproteobacteria bacterium]
MKRKNSLLRKIILFDAILLIGCTMSKSTNLQNGDQYNVEKISNVECGRVSQTRTFRSNQYIDFEIDMFVASETKKSRVVLFYQFDSGGKCTITSDNWIKVEMDCRGNYCVYRMGPNSLYEEGEISIPVCKVAEDIRSICYFFSRYSYDGDVMCTQVKRDSSPFVSIRDNSIPIDASVELFDSCSEINESLVSSP